MSKTLNLASMEALVAEKVPLGLSTAFIDNRIFEAYRWIEEQGSFLWNVVNQDIIVRANTFWVDPTDMPGGSNLSAAPPIDVGKPVIIYGSTSPAYVPGRTSIPYVSPDKIGLHQLYHTPSIAGFFSCFTFVTSAATVGFLPATGQAWPSGVPYIQFAPSSASVQSDKSFHCIYHMQPTMNLATFGANTNFFPTPDAFDDLIVNLAVAFAREIYHLAGADDAVKKSQAQIAQLLDRYRSDKLFQEGLIAESSQAQETQVKGVTGV